MRTPGLLLLALTALAPARAQAPAWQHPPLTAPTHDASAQAVTPGQYLARLAQLRQIAAGCALQAAHCDPGPTAEDLDLQPPETPSQQSAQPQSVQPQSVQTQSTQPQSAPPQSAQLHSIQIRLDWLRIAFEDARTQPDPARAERMAAVTTRLSEDAAELSAPAAAPAFTPARKQARTILARPEFRSVQQVSLWQQLAAAIERWLNQHSVASHLPRAPWLAALLEWGFLLAAAAALLLWVWRTNRQQQLVTGPAAPRPATWEKESEDWARRAQLSAEHEDWREAVHSLYWAAIVLLEGQRLWRKNLTRTPREYLPLLEPGSPRRDALTGLTRILERIWYGLRPAARTDFEQAQTLFQHLRSLPGREA